MISRSFASIFPRQSPSSLIVVSINAEADSTGRDFFMEGSNSRTYFSCPRAMLCRRPYATSGSYRTHEPRLTVLHRIIMHLQRHVVAFWMIINHYEIHEDSFDRDWTDAGMRSCLVPNRRARHRTGTRRPRTPSELVVSGWWR